MQPLFKLTGLIFKETYISFIKSLHRNDTGQGEDRMVIIRMEQGLGRPHTFQGPERDRASHTGTRT